MACRKDDGEQKGCAKGADDAESGDASTGNEIEGRGRRQKEGMSCATAGLQIPAHSFFPVPDRRQHVCRPELLTRKMISTHLLLQTQEEEEAVSCWQVRREIEEPAGAGKSF